MSNHLTVQDTADKIAGKIDKDVTKSLALTNSSGGLNLKNIDQVMELAKMMAVSGVAVRKHLRNNPGVCLAVAIQAFEWEMSPYAVANKSYAVNDQLAFEAQLIHAVILRRAPIKGRPKTTYKGDGQDRSICISVETTDGQVLEYESPKLEDIAVKNSPLWKADPDQQQHYYGMRAMARRHFPDVILGIYSRDELEDAKDITPNQPQGSGLAARLNQRQNIPQSNGGFNPDAVAAETGDAVASEASDETDLLRENARKTALNGGPRELPPVYDDGSDEAETWFAAYDEAAKEGGSENG
jgi:hypothetical protein